MFFCGDKNEYHRAWDDVINLSISFVAAGVRSSVITSLYSSVVLLLAQRLAENIGEVEGLYEGLKIFFSVSRHS